MGECCGEEHLPPAEMGSPSSSQNLSNAPSLTASRAPGEQGRYELCPTYLLAASSSLQHCLKPYAD